MSFESKYKKAKETIARLHKKAREVGAGTKPMLLAAGAGGGGQYLTDIAAENIDTVRENWWGNGATLAAEGFVLRKRSRVASLGLAGAAGYALAEDRKRFKGDASVERPWYGQGADEGKGEGNTKGADAGAVFGE